jgi:hypothetical protein
MTVYCQGSPRRGGSTFNVSSDAFQYPFDRSVSRSLRRFDEGALPEYDVDWRPENSERRRVICMLKLIFGTHRRFGAPPLSVSDSSPFAHMILFVERPAGIRRQSGQGHDEELSPRYL